MALNFKQRISILDTHFNFDVPVAPIAKLLQVSIEEVQEVLDIGEDYLGQEKMPRRRPKREESGEPAAPKTRARTNTPIAEESRPLTAAEAENRPIVTPPKPRGNDAERATFSPGEAA